MKTNLTAERASRYKTAKATVACAAFKAGEYVSVSFSHFGTSGIAWFMIDRSQNGPLSQVVAYPENHLTQFCL